MRLLNVLSYYAPHISGLTEYVRLVSEWLAGSGDADVTVLALQHSPELPMEEWIAGVRVVRGRPLLKLHKGALSLDFLAKYRQLAKEADVVHLHAPMLEAGLLARWTPSEAALVASWVCDLSPSARWSLVDRSAVAAVRWSSKVCLRRAERVCVLSHDYAAGSPVLRGLERKWEAIAPPDNAPEGLAVRATGSGAKRIGFLGRFVEEKGIGVLLDAAPAVLREFPDAVFVLAGEYQNVPGGSEYQRLRHKLGLLGNRVMLRGKLPYSELFEFYRSLDVFVLPSVNAYEAFGIVQVEAMKSGVPVVASDLRGVRVPVTETGNGLLVLPGRPEELARGIVEVLRRRWDPSDVARRAWDRFSTRQTAKQLMEVYCRCLSEQPRAAAR